MEMRGWVLGDMGESYSVFFLWAQLAHWLIVRLLNPELFGAIAPGVLKEILTLPGLKREGEMRRFVEERNGSRVQQYVDVKGDVVPFPDSLKVRYGK